MNAPPLLDEFCRFFIDLHPRRMIVSHLWEFGRAAEDYWDREHFEKIFARCQEIAPHIPVNSAFMGESVNL